MREISPTDGGHHSVDGLKPQTPASRTVGQKSSTSATRPPTHPVPPPSASTASVPRPAPKTGRSTRPAHPVRHHPPRATCGFRRTRETRPSVGADRRGWKRPTRACPRQWPASTPSKPPASAIAPSAATPPCMATRPLVKPQAAHGPRACLGRPPSDKSASPPATASRPRCSSSSRRSMGRAGYERNTTSSWTSTATPSATASLMKGQTPMASLSGRTSSSSDRRALTSCRSRL